MNGIIKSALRWLVVASSGFMKIGSGFQATLRFHFINYRGNNDERDLRNTPFRLTQVA
jgi:hypothetical protein